MNSTSRALAAVALALALVTCRDGTGPRIRMARVAVAPILPSDANVASFGLVIDRVRLVVVRPATDTLADTTVVLPPDSAALDLDLRVPLLAVSETLQVSIIALAGAVPLFQGTSPVEVRSGGTPAAPTEIPVLTYVGPGAGVDSLVVSPGTPFIYLNDSLRFQVQAFQAGVPVPQFYIAWSTSDTSVARIRGDGTLRAPNARTSVRVIARTPGGTASDSTTATFVPLPNQIVAIAGGGQTGPVGQPLGTQLEIEVRASDNLPVGGVAVRFRSLSNGLPVDTIITSDAAGRARVTWILGPTPGPQTFQVTLPAFPSVVAASFSATATGIVISPATSIVTVSSGSVISGNTVQLKLRAKDQSGNDFTSGGAVVVFTRSGGSSTGAISATTDSGTGVYTAIFTGALAGTATTIGATINGAPVTTTLPTISVSPAGISPSGSVVTVSSGTVTSGAAVTLRLQARDAAGNVVTTGGAAVAFSFSGGTSTGAIGTTADSGNGIYTAPFTGVLAGTATTISATVNAAPVTTPKPSIAVTPGAPAELVFTVQPIAAAVGVAIAPAIAVGARDLAGNPTPAFAGDVTIAIGTNPSGGILTGTLTQTTGSGVAVFADLAIDQPGLGYTLVVTAPGVAPDTSATFDVVPPSGTILWSNPAGGNWSNPANWSGGAVPGFTETAAITLPGTYTVILDQGDTIAGLQVGGSSGVQTLSGAGRVLHVSGATQISANGVLDLRASTLAGGTLTNAGTVQITGSSTISQAIATTATSLIRIQGNNVYGHSTLNVANGFVTNGAIVLTDTISTYGATLAIPAGQSLTIGSSGSLEAAVGSGGARNLTAALDNQGTVTLNRPLTINRASAVHANSGTIDILAGDLTLSQSGGGAGFFTNGTISIAAGYALAVSGGNFDFTAGSIVGAGTLSLTSTTVTIIPTLSTGSVGVSLTSTTVGGPGTLDVADTTSLVVRASTINASFANHGLATFNGSSTLNGTVVNDSTATLRVQGNNVYGHATLTVASSFTSDGTIVLTDTVSTYGATLALNAGATLTNTGTIDAAVGSAGARNLTAALDNQGTVTLNRGLLINRTSAVHTNSGTLDVTGGDLTLSQSGASASFTMVGSGAVNVAPGRTFAITGGALNYDAGSISGGGTLVITSTAVTSTQGFNTATAALSLISSTWGGTGALTVSPSTVLDVRASTISAPLANQAAIHVTGSSAFNGGFTNPSPATLKIQGNNVYGHATLTVGTSFTNGGTIVLTDTISTYGATLTMPAGTTLTNAAGGTIDAAAGFAGTRTLTVELDNQGTVTLNRGLTLNRASAAHLNSGTINVSAGDFTLSQTGTSPSFTTSGSILIGSGRTFAMSGGAFNYNAGAITGGTLSVTSTNVTATQNFNTATSSLSIASSTWGGTGTLTLSASTEVRLRASTINAPLVNEGLLIASGSSAINGTLANDPAATLRVQGDNTYGAGNLTIANSFANDGAIELTDTVSTYGATLTMPVGQTLTNAAGGTISALPGTNGSRTLTAQIDNYGVLTVATAATQGLTINRSGAQHQNRGTIVISGGDLTVSQSGASPSFRTTGAISVAAGDTLHVTGGSFVYDSGTISGAGALTLASLTGSAAFNIAHSIASLSVTSSTASFATAQSTGSTGFFFSSATINGPGLLTNAAGQFLNVRASTINADLVNQGTLLVNGASSFTGVLTTDTSSVIRVQGNGIYGHSTLTVSNAFTNNGIIELTDTTSTYGATLTLIPAGGTLTNSPTGTIAAVVGSGGSRTLSAQLDNQGAVSVALAPNGLLTFGRSGAVHLNSGVFDISGGDVTLTQSAGGSLTNTGTIAVAAGDTLTVNNGSLTHNAGTFGGAGTLVLSGVVPATFNVPHTFAAMNVTSSTVAFATPQSTGATGFAFTGSTINGPGSLTNDPSRTLVLRSTVVNAPLINLGTLVVNGATTFNDTLTTSTSSLIRVKGDGVSGAAGLTVTKGFENAGTVELTDTLSTYGATLTIPVANGKLVNLPGAFVNVVTGGSGSRTLTAAFDNQGALTVALPPGRDLVVNASGANHLNSGTIDVTGGDLVISAGAAFQNVGAINLGATDTLSMSNGQFSYDAGTLGTGTMVLNSVNPANFNKSHTLSAIVLNNTTAVFAAPQSTASTMFALTGSVFAGTATLTNDPGQTIRMRASNISAPFVNQGTVVATGASSLDLLTTATGSTLRVEGDGTSGAGTLTVSGGLINNGAVELTDVGSTYGATLVVKTLPLVNAGTIDIQTGANGARTIDAVIDNQGTFTGNRSVLINTANAVHTNRGLYKVRAGSITFQQSGGNPSFTNQAGGVIDIDAGTVFAVTAGTVNNDLGGKISGSGTLDVRAPAIFSHNGEIIPGASPGKLTIAGNMQIPTTGVMTIELGGPTAGTEYDQLAITGAAIFAEGTINVTTIGAFDPKGLSFDVMTFGPGSTTGPIRTANLPPSCAGGQVVNTGTSLRVTCP